MKQFPMDKNININKKGKNIPSNSDDNISPMKHSNISKISDYGQEKPFNKANFKDPIFDKFSTILGKSSVMAKILNEAYNFARSNCSILIQGESGTGKDLIASEIHNLSERSKKEMITINCCAMSASILESELFGHVKGAFTGANTHKQGFFQKANGSTLFLDEIGDMPSQLQAKLLRVLQNQAFYAVGSTNKITTDVRIIAATNMDLKQGIAKKSFRLDLYHRLNVLALYVPPLRQRICDLPILVEHFSKIVNEKCQLRCFISDNCMEFLMGYHWPGNIRECQNLISRLLITKRSGTVSINDLPKKFLEDYDHFQRHFDKQSKFNYKSINTNNKNNTKKLASQDNKTFYDHLRNINNINRRSKKNIDYNDYLSYSSNPEYSYHSNEDHQNYDDDKNTQNISNDFDKILKNHDNNQIDGFKSNEFTKNININQISGYDISRLCDYITLPAKGINLLDELKKLEINIISKALLICGQNKNKAANLLGMKRTTLVEKIKRAKIININI